MVISPRPAGFRAPCADPDRPRLTVCRHKVMSQGDGLIGEKLGSFRIEAVLGSGAMGVVYRGTNEKSGKPAAIKVMSGDCGHKGTIGHRFERESEILQQLRHPNIVR